MPTFFFDTDIDGQSSVDTEGVVFPDVGSARREARVALCELAAELETDSDLTRMTMQVRDGLGEVVVTLSLNVKILSASRTEPERRCA